MLGSRKHLCLLIAYANSAIQDIPAPLSALPSFHNFNHQPLLTIHPAREVPDEFCSRIVLLREALKYIMRSAHKPQTADGESPIGDFVPRIVGLNNSSNDTQIGLPIIFNHALDAGNHLVGDIDMFATNCKEGRHTDGGIVLREVIDGECFFLLISATQSIVRRGMRAGSVGLIASFLGIRIGYDFILGIGGMGLLAVGLDRAGG
jgi:hypothetical protein